MDTHDYPLLIKHLMLVPLRQPNGHGIVYRDLTRYDYKSFGQRWAASEARSPRWACGKATRSR